MNSNTVGSLDTVPNEGMLDLSEAAWQEAKRKAAVIAPLASQNTLHVVNVNEAAAKLSLSARSVYGLVRRYRASGGLLSSLAPRISSGGRGRGRLSPIVESIITDVIESEYLRQQRKRVQAVVRAVTWQCQLQGVPVPSNNTIRLRVAAVKAEIAAKKRYGSKSSRARELTPAAGRFPLPEHSLDVVQIDHTLVDIILVDEVDRRPIGRPWLTVAIDTYSRAIAGFHLSLESPSATTVGLCLSHLILPKGPYLHRMQLDELIWPIEGKPKALHLDNAAEFHSVALSRGCEQHGIKLLYRPVATPHYGGIVERVIGTLMAMVHELPGTTFSNISERGDYNSDAKACLTIAELEHWFVLAIAGRYHGKVHASLGESPLQRYIKGLNEVNPPPKIMDQRAFLIDFLPIFYRRVTRIGITLDHLSYYCDALRPLIAAREGLGPLLVRRDPRNLSRIWVLDPEDNVYVEVPYAHQGAPSISLHEHRIARLRLREAGEAKIDEKSILTTALAQREIIKKAASKSRSARRLVERRKRVDLPEPQPIPTESLEKAVNEIVDVKRLYGHEEW